MPYLAHTSPDHDEALIARLAADDLTAGSADDRLARSWVTDCPACAELLGDLRAIVAATSALPAPRRTRDFRLTEADASRLRSRGWRGLVARFGTPGMAFTRPLAAGLATLGIAGLLLASLPSGLLGSASSTSERALSPIGNQAGGGSYGAAVTAAPAPAIQGAAPSPAGSAVPAAPAASAAASAPAASANPVPAASAQPDSGLPSSAPASPGAGGVGVTSDGSSKGSGGPGQGLSSPPTAASSASDSGVPESGGGPSPLAALSFVLLAAGLVLGGLRLAARRLG